MLVVEFIRTFAFFKKANILEEFGRSSEANFLLGPNGEEVPVPGMTHTGEAQKILSQQGQNYDPDMALDMLLRQGWIRVSGEQFEVYGYTAAKKSIIANFIRKHKDFYQDSQTIELDNRKKGFSKQFPIKSILGQGSEESAQEAGRIITERQPDKPVQKPQGYIPDYLRKAPELVKQKFREGD